MSWRPDNLLNDLVKAANTDRIWTSDVEMAKAMTRRMRQAEIFRVPWQIATMARMRSEDLRGVRMPYPEMVLEFSDDDGPPVADEAGKRNGVILMMHCKEIGDPDSPTGFEMTVPMYFAHDRVWGFYPFKVACFYPDQVEWQGDTSDFDPMDKLAMVITAEFPETAQAFSEMWIDEGLDEGQRSVRVISHYREVAGRVLALATMLTCQNVNETTVKPSKSQRKRTRARTGLPAYEYKTLDIFIDDAHAHGEHQGGEHEGPRLHMVRGHFKNRKTGRFWWRPHVRGDADKGVVEKQYNIRQHNRRTAR